MLEGNDRAWLVTDAEPSHFTPMQSLAAGLGCIHLVYHSLTKTQKEENPMGTEAQVGSSGLGLSRFQGAKAPSSGSFILKVFRGLTTTTYARRVCSCSLTSN